MTATALETTADTPVAYVALYDYGSHEGSTVLGVADTLEDAKMIAEGHLSVSEAAKVRDWCEPSTDSDTYAMIGPDYSIDVRQVPCLRKTTASA